MVKLPPGRGRTPLLGIQSLREKDQEEAIFVDETNVDEPGEVKMNETNHSRVGRIDLGYLDYLQ